MLKRSFMLVLFGVIAISLSSCAWCEKQGRVETTAQRQAEVTQPAPPPPPPAYQPAPKKARN